MQSGSLGATIFSALLVRGRFAVSKTIIPEHRITLFSLQLTAALISSVDWGAPTSNMWDLQEGGTTDGSPPFLRLSPRDILINIFRVATGAP